MNRRHFLVSAGTAATASFAGSPSDRVRLGIMGVRGRGRYLAGRFAELPDAEIAYFAEVDDSVVPRALKMVANAGRPAPKVVRDVRRILEDKTIDALVVATPITGTRPQPYSPVTLVRTSTSKSRFVTTFARAGS